MPSVDKAKNDEQAHEEAKTSQCATEAFPPSKDVKTVSFPRIVGASHREHRFLVTLLTSFYFHAESSLVLSFAFVSPRKLHRLFASVGLLLGLKSFSA